jgi:hypothetical protein
MFRMLEVLYPHPLQSFLGATKQPYRCRQINPFGQRANSILPTQFNLMAVSSQFNQLQAVDKLN